MIEYLRERRSLSGQWLAQRYPEAWLLRVHVLGPVLLVLYALVTVAAEVNPVSAHAVPDMSSRMGIGFLLSLVVEIIWVFFVVRDARMFWPQRGWRKLAGLFGAFSCLAAIACLPCVYFEVLGSRVVRPFNLDPEKRSWNFSADINTRLSHLNQDYEFLEGLRRERGPDHGDAARARDQLMLRNSVQSYIQDRNALEKELAKLGEFRTSISSEYGPPDRHAEFLSAMGEAYSTSSTLRSAASEIFSPCLAAAVVLLAILVVLRETPIRFGIIGLAIFAGYSALWGVAIATLQDRPVPLFARVALAHYVFWAAAACVQWARRSNSWRTRGNALALGLATPFLPLLWAVTDHTIDSETFLRFLLASSGVYVLAFPLIHGNLARLKFLPRPY
jgi:hypothetical protein